MPAISSATAVIGDSGSGKSTLLATYGDWVWRKYQVKTRLYHFDLSKWSTEVQALINLGIIEAWKVYTRDTTGEGLLVSETIMRACQGWWPEQLDPESGNSPHAVRLVKPPQGWRGAVMYDGITSMCAWSMQEMGVRAAKGILGGEGSNMKTVASGEMSMGSGNRASVGFTQNKSREWVMTSVAIPGLVAPPVFTCLEQKVLDSETKLPLYGPQLAGQAKTVEALSWFGPKLGALGPIGDASAPEWRLHLKDYFWPKGDTTPHKCDARVGASAKLPEYIGDGPGVKTLEKFSLGWFMDLCAKAEGEAQAEFEKKYAGMSLPGMGRSTVKVEAPAAPTIAVAPSAPPRGTVAAPPPVPTPVPAAANVPPAVAAAMAARRAGASAAPVVQVSEAEIQKVEGELSSNQHGGAAAASTVAAGAAPPSTPPLPPPPPGIRPPARAPIAARAGGAPPAIPGWGVVAVKK